MEFTRLNQEARQDRFEARAKSARKYARFVQFCLLVACATAIWQERALFPKGHDKMKTTVAWAGEMLENTDAARSYLTAMSGFTGNGNQSEFDPITDALLKMRN